MQNPRDAYLASSVLTASPARLLVMLYDRLVLDLQRASEGLGSGNPAAAHEPLMHAQEIILELRASLSPEQWAGGPGLAALYEYLHAQLVRANVSKDRTITDFCLETVSGLRDAWRVAAGELVSVSA